MALRARVNSEVTSRFGSALREPLWPLAAMLDMIALGKICAPDT